MNAEQLCQMIKQVIANVTLAGYEIVILQYVMLGLKDKEICHA